jgi:hypothetical protein
LAIEAGNVVLAIEAHRMRGFCLAQVGDLEAANQQLQLALALGQRLKPESRSMTTLPIAAMDRLRVLDAGRVEAMQQIRGRLDDQARQARDELEQSAPTADRAAAMRLEQRYDARLRQADDECHVELVGVVNAAPAQFADGFQQARALLGDDWPLDNAIALPAPVKDSAAA